MKQCLLADDSAVIRKVARRILEDLDFDVLEAEDGRTALDICGEEMPDIILLDWNMPEFDGVEFLKELRRMEGGKQPKVVFCTTENDVVTIARAMRAGANHHLMKPFDRAILTAKLAEAGILSPVS